MISSLFQKFAYGLSVSAGALPFAQLATTSGFARYVDFYQPRKRSQQFLDVLAGRRIGQSAVHVEALCRIADHHFRPIEQRHVEGDQDLARMV